MSGIYIPGKHIKMPENCASCRFLIGSGGTFPRELFCEITKKDIEDYHVKSADCPLVFVPDHWRLIEAEPIQMFITAGLNSGEFGYEQIKVLAEIQYAPTILPADVADNGV